MTVDPARNGSSDDDFDLAAEVDRSASRMRAERQRLSRTLNQADLVAQANARIMAERHRLAKQAAEILISRGHPPDHAEYVVLSSAGHRTIFGGWKTKVVREISPTMVWHISQSWYTPGPSESDPYAEPGPPVRQGHALGMDGREFKLTGKDSLINFDMPAPLTGGDLERQVQARIQQAREMFKWFVAEQLGLVPKDDFWDK